LEPLRILQSIFLQLTRVGNRKKMQPLKKGKGKGANWASLPGEILFIIVECYPFMIPPLSEYRDHLVQYPNLNRFRKHDPDSKLDLPKLCIRMTTVCKNWKAGITAKQPQMTKQLTPKPQLQRMKWNIGFNGSKWFTVRFLGILLTRDSILINIGIRIPLFCGIQSNWFASPRFGMYRDRVMTFNFTAVINTDNVYEVLQHPMLISSRVEHVDCTLGWNPEQKCWLGEFRLFLFGNNVPFTAKIKGTNLDTFSSDNVMMIPPARH